MSAASARRDPVRSRETFADLRRSSSRGRIGPLSVSFVARPEWDRSQVAYAVSRKVGNAVERNRLRRRLRAIVAERSPELPVGAYQVRSSRRWPGPRFRRTEGGHDPSIGRGDEPVLRNGWADEPGRRQYRREFPGGQPLRARPRVGADRCSRPARRPPGRSSRSSTPISWPARVGRPAAGTYPAAPSTPSRPSTATGPGTAAGLAVRRISRCGPWGGHGIDPVPERSTP